MVRQKNATLFIFTFMEIFLKFQPPKKFRNLILLISKVINRFAVLLIPLCGFCANIFRNNYYYFQKQTSKEIPLPENKNWFYLYAPLSTKFTARVCSIQVPFYNIYLCVACNPIREL